MLFALLFITSIFGLLFMKNMSLVGASLMIMYWGSGPYSLDT